MFKKLSYTKDLVIGTTKSYTCKSQGPSSHISRRFGRILHRKSIRFDITDQWHIISMMDLKAAFKEEKVYVIISLAIVVI